MINMRHMDIRVCRECKEPYLRETGGIVATPQDYMDSGLCKKCRRKRIIKILYDR